MPASRGIHLFALILAAATFLLILAGALVTSNDAGLAVPDWPTSFGSFYKMPPMVGGIKFEHGHRMIAETIGLATVILCFLVLRRSGLRKAAMHALGMTVLFLGAIFSVAAARSTPLHRALLDRATALALVAILGLGALFVAATLIARSFARHWPAEAKIAVIALPTVMIQGVFGGLTVLFFLPWYISTAHATVAQTFFCLIVLLAFITSSGWSSHAALPQPGRKDKVIRVHAYASIAAVYIQLILGAAFRHGGISIRWHIFWAVLVTILLGATGIRILVEHGGFAPLRRSATALLAMLVLQLGLGFAAYLTRVVWSKDAAQPLAGMVASTVAHVGGGAILLAILWILAAQVNRYLPQRRSAATSLRRPQAVTA